MNEVIDQDADGKDDPLTTLSAVVSGGRIKCKWQVKYTADEDDADSQQELAERGYTLPEYAFVVECGGAESGESGVLEVRGWIYQEVKYYKSGSEVKEMKYHLEFSDTYEIEGRITSGSIKEEELPFGNIVLRISLK